MGRKNRPTKKDEEKKPAVFYFSQTACRSAACGVRLEGNKQKIGLTAICKADFNEINYPT